MVMVVELVHRDNFGSCRRRRSLERCERLLAEIWFVFGLEGLGLGIEMGMGLGWD